MPGQDVFYQLGLRQGIVKRQNCPTRNPGQTAHALSFEQDPWKERIETPQLKKEFNTIKIVQIEEATV